MTNSHIGAVVYMTYCLIGGGKMKNNLKKLRLERSLTQIALQMKTGIDQALISKYEKGERIPPTDTLMILADFFGVSMDYIMCRTDNPNVNK